MKDNELLKCTCGGSPTIVAEIKNGAFVYSTCEAAFVAVCPDCNRKTSQLRTHEEAIDAWNLRLLDKSEYDRLKRLDENVKAKITAYKLCYNGNFGSSYQERVNFLESLYK